MSDMPERPFPGTYSGSTAGIQAGIPAGIPAGITPGIEAGIPAGISKDIPSDTFTGTSTGISSGSPAGQDSLSALPEDSGQAAAKDNMVHLIPLKNRKKSLASLLSGRVLLAAGLDWTRAEPGLSLKEQASREQARNSWQGSFQNSYQNSRHDGWQGSLNGSLKGITGLADATDPASDPAGQAPDHGLVIEERAGFARLYGLHDRAKACAATALNEAADGVHTKPEGTICDAFCTVCSLAALRLQSLRHGIEIWPLPQGTLTQGSLPKGSLPKESLPKESLPGDSPDSNDSLGSPENPDSLNSSDSLDIPASPDSPESPGSSQDGTGIHGTQDNGDSLDNKASQASKTATWWVFAARLGRLSARADKCFATYAEALALARRLQDSLDLQAPRVLSEAEVEEELKKLAIASPEAMHRAKLKPLSLMSCQVLHNTSLRRGLAAFLFGGLVISACFFLSDPIAQRLSPASPALVQKHDAAAAVLRHPELYFPSDWMSAPSPAASVLATVPQMLKTPLAANGWTLEEVCAGKGTLTALWKAARASSLLLPPEGAERFANDATRARSVTETPPPGSHARQWQDLGTKDEVQAVLSELAARFGLKMQLSWKPARTIKKDNAVISCPWVAGSLVLSQAPGTLFFDFGSLTDCLKEQRLERCLVLSGITWNKTQWIMQGEVYAKR